MKRSEEIAKLGGKPAMSEVCICKFPIWMYDQNGKEYFAIPVEVAEEMNIKRLPIDLEVTVDIDGQPVKFLAIPFETVAKRGIEVPEIEIVDHDIPVGIKGDYITKQFTKVKWNKVTDDLFTKKYDIRDHIVIAGCKHSETSKIFDKSEGKEKLHCTEKETYSVLHPMDEFLNEHIGEIEAAGGAGIVK